MATALRADPAHALAAAEPTVYDMLEAVGAYHTATDEPRSIHVMLSHRGMLVTIFDPDGKPREAAFKMPVSAALVLAMLNETSRQGQPFSLVLPETIEDIDRETA